MMYSIEQLTLQYAVAAVNETTSYDSLLTWLDTENPIQAWDTDDAHNTGNALSYFYIAAYVLYAPMTAPHISIPQRERISTKWDTLRQKLQHLPDRQYQDMRCAWRVENIEWIRRIDQHTPDILPMLWQAYIPSELQHIRTIENVIDHPARRQMLQSYWTVQHEIDSFSYRCIPYKEAYNYVLRNHSEIPCGFAALAMGTYEWMDHIDIDPEFVDTYTPQWPELPWYIYYRQCIKALDAKNGVAHVALPDEHRSTVRIKTMALFIWYTQDQAYNTRSPAAQARATVVQEWEHRYPEYMQRVNTCLNEIQAARKLRKELGDPWTEKEYALYAFKHIATLDIQPHDFAIELVME